MEYISEISILDIALEEVKTEILRAKAQWGDNFDNANTQNDWNAYINIYLSKAAEMSASPEVIKKNIRKAAGLALAMYTQHLFKGFAPRHYEEQVRPKSLPEIGEN